MSSFELNKFLGAILGTCLVVVALNITAGALFAPETPAKPGYNIVVEEQPKGGTQANPAQEQQPFETVLASANPEHGANGAKVCGVCHTFTKGGANGLGPNLYGVIGRQAGKLKGLGIAADKRVAVAPNVPTYAEQGFPGFTAATWVGFFAPAKTDPQIVATLNAAINAIVTAPEVQTKLTAMGFDPITGSPAQAQAMFDDEVKKWGDVVKALGLSLK